MEMVIEVIIKNRVSPIMERYQNQYQQDFTANTSPLHAVLIVEEISRDSKDNSKKLNIDYIFLDAKAAFDVVNHNYTLIIRISCLGARSSLDDHTGSS